MGKIIPFPLREEFQAQWDDLVDYFSALIHEEHYMTVSLYMGTSFLVEYHFTSFHDFRARFVPWFENLSFWGGK
jgi:hypothetical protein